MAKHFTPIEEGIAKAKTTIAKISTGLKSLQDIDSSKAPPLKADVGGLSAQISGFGTAFSADQTNIQTAFEQRRTEIAKGLPESQTKGIASFLGGILKEKQDIIAKQPSSIELHKSILAEFGFSPASFQKQNALIGQLVDFQKQMADLEAVKQTRLLNAEQQFQGYLTLALRGEQSLIERRYNSEIAAKGAQASVIALQFQLERQLFQDAVQMTNQLVQLATFDQQQKLSDLDFVRDTYLDIFNLMDKAEQREWERSYDLTKIELDTAKQEKRDKLDLMVQAWQSGINPSWTADYMDSKSLEELMTEVGPGIAAAERAERVKRAKDKAPKIVGFSKFSLETGLFGLTFQQVQDLTSNPNAPQWFENQLLQALGTTDISLDPKLVQAEWEELQRRTQKAIEESGKRKGFDEILESLIE